MPFGLTWLSRTCGTTNLQCSEQAGQLVDHLIPSRSPMSMSLGDWEISLRRHGLSGESENNVDCSDSDAISTRVPTADAQNRYIDGLAEVREEEPYESFDVASHTMSQEPPSRQVEVFVPQRTEEAVSIVRDDSNEEFSPPAPRRRRKVIRKIFKALPVRITFGSNTEGEAEVRSKVPQPLNKLEENSEAAKSLAPPTEVQHMKILEASVILPEVTIETPLPIRSHESTSKPQTPTDTPCQLAPPNQCGLSKTSDNCTPSKTPEPVRLAPPTKKDIESPPTKTKIQSSPPAVDQSRASDHEKQDKDEEPQKSDQQSSADDAPKNRAEQCRSRFVPNLPLTINTTSATVVKKYSQMVPTSQATTLNLKVLETQSSQSSHEPFSGMSEPMESQSTSFQASPLALERMPSNTERADRDDTSSVAHLSVGSSTTREKTGSHARADFPCQFIPVQEGSATPPLTVEQLRTSSTATCFKSLTSLIFIQNGRLLVKQAFKPKEVIAVIDPVLLCSGREQSCCLGMAGYVSSFATKPGFPEWGDSNTSFISHMSLTISRQEPKGHVLKGVYPYCHLLFKTNSEPNVDCLFHAHQVILVALTSLAPDAPLSAHRPPHNMPLRDIRSKLYRSCSTNVQEPFGTGSRADINHFSLHAETERYSARKSTRKESKSPMKVSESPKKEQASELVELTTQSTEVSRDAADALSDRLATEDQGDIVVSTEQKPNVDETKASKEIMVPPSQPFALLLATKEPAQLKDISAQPLLGEAEHNSNVEANAT